MNRVRIIGKTILEKYHGFFSVDQVMRDTKIPRRNVRDILSTLFHEGAIKEIERKKKEHIPGRPPSYSIIFRANRKKLTERIAPRRSEITVQDRLWSVIRNKMKSDGAFTLGDLLTLAEAKRYTARWYLKTLRKAGYIQPSNPAGPGVYWTLIKDPGPRRPYVGGQKAVGSKQ